MKKELKVFLLLVLVGVLSRLIPHPWNFTGITAMAIFTGVNFRQNKFLIFSPLVALFISDLILGLHATMVFTYLGFSLVGFLAASFSERQVSLVKKTGFGASMTKSLQSIGVLSLVSSFIFYLVTNLGVWLTTAIYEKTMQGLFACYIAGLPFLDNQILGDLFYSTIFYIVFYSWNSLSLVEVE
ncbi:MAG: hypothetical protein L6Q37_14290 [Bdellovibrionaceae bacterium]|nr:hypothetical protein [Pseudobdellovibrionaceae bacterium]NUM58324.1 hypothetical protein [Pseudobdellovibrionaceae bacterium]